MKAISTMVRRSPDLGLEIKRLNRLRLAGSFCMIPVLLFLVLFSSSAEGLQYATRIPGALLLAAGVGLRLWALGCIGADKKRMLVCWGAYSNLRHPLYLGSLLILLGFCLMSGSWSATACAIAAFLLLYLPVIRAEERLLASQFGDAWQSYCRRSRAFFPRLPWRRDPAARPFRLVRPRREIAVLTVLLLGVIAAAELVRLVRRGLDLPPYFL